MTLSVAAMIAATGQGGWPLLSARAASILSESGGFADDFEAGLSVGKPGGWSLTQIQRGAVTRITRPGEAGSWAVQFTAGAKQGGKVGKADLVKRFDPIGVGQTISVSADFYFPAGTPRNSIVLMDMECGSCGLDTNPGVRVYLRDGRLRVDRSKIGIKDAFMPSVDHQVGPDKWHRIEWRSTLGKDAAGLTEIFLDGRRVVSASGTNLIDQEIINRLASITIKERVDRVQLGLTANSNLQPATLLMDNARIVIGGS